MYLRPETERRGTAYSQDLIVNIECVLLSEFQVVVGSLAIHLIWQSIDFVCAVQSISSYTRFQNRCEIGLLQNY